MLFVYAGILYLVGIAFLLVWKPSLMFTSQGDWKEFGLGRSSEEYTWMPFWLCSIVWAIVAYLLVFVLSGASTSTVSEMSQPGYYVRTRDRDFLFLGKRPPRILYYDGDGIQGDHLLSFPSSSDA